MTPFFKKSTKNPTNSTTITPPPPQLTHRLILLFSFLFLLLFSLFFTSCQCGVETKDEDGTSSSSNPLPPKATLSYPKDKATNVPFSTSFEMFLDFDKVIQFNPDTNNISNITLIATTNTDSTTEDAYQFDSLDSRLSIEDKKLILLLTNILLPSTEYTFTLPQDFVLDDTALSNKEVTLTFTTADRITLDISLLSINTTNWYETRSTENGSFNQVITLTYPTLLYAVSNNDSLTGFFDTDLTDQIGTPTSPVTISNLPNGLKLRISKQANGSQLRLIGNATSHNKRTDNTSFILTLHDDFFDVDTADNIHFDFDITFGSFWTKRTQHEAFVYDDKLWVLGGAAGIGTTYYNDIWTSSDKGTNWFKVIVNGTSWGGRYAHQSFFYNDKLWVLGGGTATDTFGKNDIWTSEDNGVTWSKEIISGTHWGIRLAHQALIYDDKLWVLGGFIATDLIWNSEEGTNWSQITVNNPDWAFIYSHQAFAYNNKLWILGGAGGDDGIWYSDDKATNWNKVVVNDSHWESRSGHQAFVHNDKLWVLGGVSADNTTSYNDIWYSTNGGTNWSSVSVENSYWAARTGHGAFSYDDKLWVLGGSTGVVQNDIWTSSDGGTNWEQITTEYY